MNKLIIHLIQEQIRNQVLITSLEKLGFDCTIYTLNISEIILNLVGFKDKPDQLYHFYFELIEEAVKQTSYRSMDESMGRWSKVIFNELHNIYMKGLSP